MENNKTPDGRLLVVTCKETDPSCIICKDPSNLSVCGLFTTQAEAAACANTILVARRRKLAAYYEGLCAEISKESSNIIAELADERDPDERSIKQFVLDQLRKQEQQHLASMVPDLLLLNDAEGRLCEVTARDESLDWTCCIEIEMMETGKTYDNGKEVDA